MLAEINISAEGLKDITAELFWTTEHKEMDGNISEKIRTLEDLSQRPTAKEQAFQKPEQINGKGNQRNHSSQCPTLRCAFQMEKAHQQCGLKGV